MVIDFFGDRRVSSFFLDSSLGFGFEGEDFSPST